MPEPWRPTLCYGQDDLEPLCADRTQYTDELHTANDYYGQATVLKRFAGLPVEYPLKAVLEHGLVLDDRIWEHDRDQQLGVIFAASKHRAKTLERISGKRATPIGFGFLYAQQLVEREHPADRSERLGSIVFPCHSTHTVTARYDHDQYAERLRALPAEFRPIVVCLYWRNVELGHAECYQRRGIPVVSAGHMYDHLFLLRSYDICRKFKFAASNVLGTHTFQAIRSGCRFFHIPSSEIAWDVPDLEREGSTRGTPLDGALGDRVRTACFVEPQDIDAERQRALADEVLGADCLRSPEELAEVIAQTERDDRRLWTRVHYRGRLLLAAPAYWRRRLKFVRRIHRSISKRLPWRRAA